MVVRVFYYRDGEYEGCVDLPGNCSVRTAVRTMISRGWQEVTGNGYGNGSGRAKLANEYGEAIIENVDGNETNYAPHDQDKRAKVI